MTGKVEALLACEGVRKVYRPGLGKAPHIAVDDLTIALFSGEASGLVGANGAGKTTTLRLLLGLVRPDAGQVRFRGRPLQTADKRRIGYMAEVGRLPLALTSAELLTDALIVHGPAFAASARERKRAVDLALEEVGLASHRDKRIAHLSKGMGRRLAFALATIHKPDVLVLDEPTSGLDPLGKRDLLQRIEAAKAAGTTILLCTHELAQVTTLCETIHVLRGGRLVHTARPLAAGAAEYEITVSGADEATLARLREAQRLPAWVRCAPKGFLTRVALASYGDGAEWAKALLAQGFVLLRFGESVAAERDLLKHFSGEAT